MGVEGSLKEPYFKKQADARLTAGHAKSEKPGSDSLKTLQRIKRIEKKKQWKMWKWERSAEPTIALWW